MYHINSEQKVGRCSAKPGQCPFGGESEHFDTALSAKVEVERRKASEAAQDGKVASTRKRQDKTESFEALKESYENVAAEIIEKHNLDHGNSEISFGETHMDVTIEAPNHSTVTVTIPLDHELTDEEINWQIREEIEQMAMDFDAEQTFEELWSPEFSEHNKMSAFTFARILQEDEEFFQELAFNL